MATNLSTKYHHTGAYDRAEFLTAAEAQFRGNTRFRPSTIPGMLTLLQSIERDSQITDMRWAAYMMATVMWETTTLEASHRPAVGHNGKPLLDKHHKPKMVRVRKWVFTMSPVDEVGHGKGRPYHAAVKVKRLADGSARITEQDGDQFLVSLDGKSKRLTKGAALGSTAGHDVAKAYLDDDGEEHAYYGRGYVQLTWWSNYAAAGVAVGRGLDLLFDPELDKQPETAYGIMAYGMRTGSGFANGHRFAKYFTAGSTNYTGARHMVNGRDHANDIAELAKKFEAILLHASVNPDRTLAPQPMILP